MLHFRSIVLLPFFLLLPVFLLPLPVLAAPLPVIDTRLPPPQPDPPTPEPETPNPEPSNPFGPLRLRSQAPFQALRSGFVPRSPDTLPAGRWEFRGAGDWANQWARDEEDFLLDFETLDASLAAACGVTDDLQVEIEAENRSRFGGNLDGFLQDSHKVLNTQDRGRDDVTRGGFMIDLARHPGTTLDGGDRGTFARSLFLTAQRRLLRETECAPSLALSATARREMGDRHGLHDGSPADFGAALHAGKSLGETNLWLGAGYDRHGRERFLTLDLQSGQFSYLAALEWRVAPRTSLVLQYLFSEGVVKGLDPFRDASHEVAVGVKTALGAGAVLEFGILENVKTPENSPDFGLHVGISHRL